jgi:hypothetical protein
MSILNQPILSIQLVPDKPDADAGSVNLDNDFQPV